MLSIRNLHAGYGAAAVVRGLDAQLQGGEIVAVLGRNGSGRSTLAKAVMGMVAWRGSVTWHGTSLAGKKTFEIARMGIGYVPETRDVFAGLTVHQNLLMGERVVDKTFERTPSRGNHARRAAPQGAAAGTQSSGATDAPWNAESLYRMFPALQARHDVDAAVLSGGEQQMLALCRCLMGSPRLVIVDEPTEGLAPALVQQVADCLLTLRRRGVAVLLMEQKRMIAQSIADRVLVMGQGRIVFDGSPQAFDHRPDLTRLWLQV